MTEKALQLADAQDYLDRIISVLHDIKREERSPLVAVLEYLSDHVRATRKEIGALQRAQGDGRAFLSTTDELEEIVAETARATNVIMDSAETVERLAADVPDPLGPELLAAATRIYEASTFQDITGQRIAKVVKSLQKLEEGIGALVNACCDEPGDDPANGASPDNETALLNGPQLGDRAPTQDEIDRMFDDL